MEDKRFLILRCLFFLSLWSRIHHVLNCSSINRERELPSVGFWLNASKPESMLKSNAILIIKKTNRFTKIHLQLMNVTINSGCPNRFISSIIIGENLLRTISNRVSSRSGIPPRLPEIHLNFTICSLTPYFIIMLGLIFYSLSSK